MKQLKRKLNYLPLGLAIAALWHCTSPAQTILDPAWRVTGVDTNKPGFKWNIFANTDSANTGNSIVRADADLAGLARDSAGALLPNLADPAAVGNALAAAAPANPTNAPLYFEIPGVINLSKNTSSDKGNFTPDEQEPGVPDVNGGTDGQAAEILTYITLPAGTITMGVNSDDGFSTASGPNPQDAFGRVELGNYIGGRGASDTLFTFVVQQAGTYPFRTVWENGGGDSNIEWFTVQPDGGNKVLLNDTTNGGFPTYRALTTGALPYVKSTVPAPIPRQGEAMSSGVSVVLVDGANPLNPDSVTLQIDGKTTPVTKTRVGNLLTVDTGVLAGLHLAGERHTAVLTYADTGTFSQTKSWTFYNLENLVLPANPVTGENFDSYPEATSAATTVPPGWVVTNYTYLEDAGWDLTDIKSDAYLNWVLITTDTVLGVEDEVMDNDKTQLINGQPVTNWMSGNLIFVASDGRLRNIPDPNGNGTISVGQIQFVVSAPFNLSSVANPVLTFSSGARLSGNKEQMTMEYSIDKGTNWLPVIYMRNATTIRLLPDGSYDAVTMCTEMDTNQITMWPTPGVGPKGGNFGDMIAAPISQALAPYFANRNDGPAARRVEAIRLPQASKQSDVRLRLTHAGSCGWEWGVDNIAFYDVPPATPTPTQPTFTSIVVDGTDVVMAWTGGNGPFLIQGTAALGSAWVDLLTTTNRTARIPRAIPMTFFRIQDATTKSVALFKAVLNGANERPTPIVTPATAIGALALDGTTATYFVTYSGLLGNATMAHVHGPADANTAAGVMFAITPVGAFGTQGLIAGAATVTAAQAADIAAGKTYFNIHTTVNGGGEIRGQLLPP